MISELELAVADLPPAPEPVRKEKRWRPPHPRPGALTKRGPARPYRRVAVELLDTRIQKMTKRMERYKKQHEDVRRLLTKYSHEKTYRLREALSCHSNPLETAEQPPLQELAPISDTDEPAPMQAPKRTGKRPAPKKKAEPAPPDA